MRKGTASLLTRLERLECRSAAKHNHFKLRFGYLKRLPPEYQDEKHVVITRHLPNRGDQEWVEYEEVPGPKPDQSKQRDLGVRYFDVRFVPHPEASVQDCREEGWLTG